MFHRADTLGSRPLKKMLDCVSHYWIDVGKYRLCGDWTLADGPVVVELSLMLGKGVCFPLTRRDAARPTVPKPQHASEL